MSHESFVYILIIVYSECVCSSVCDTNITATHPLLIELKSIIILKVLVASFYHSIVGCFACAFASFCSYLSLMSSNKL